MDPPPRDKKIFRVPDKSNSSDSTRMYSKHICTYRLISGYFFFYFTFIYKKCTLRIIPLAQLVARLYGYFVSPSRHDKPDPTTGPPPGCVEFPYTTYQCERISRMYKCASALRRRLGFYFFILFFFPPLFFVRQKPPPSRHTKTHSAYGFFLPSWRINITIFTPYIRVFRRRSNKYFTHPNSPPHIDSHRWYIVFFFLIFHIFQIIIEFFTRYYRNVPVRFAGPGDMRINYGFSEIFGGLSGSVYTRSNNGPEIPHIKYL